MLQAHQLTIEAVGHEVAKNVFGCTSGCVLCQARLMILLERLHLKRSCTYVEVRNMKWIFEGSGRSYKTYARSNHMCLTAIKSIHDAPHSRLDGPWMIHLVLQPWSYHLHIEFFYNTLKKSIKVLVACYVLHYLIDMHCNCFGLFSSELFVLYNITNFQSKSLMIVMIVQICTLN